MTLTRHKARANPSKAFFVRMLTRDISLDDCILDLVDNSIDGAWQHSGEKPSTLVVDDALSDYEIQIAFDEERFSITDNCGGITLDDAADYAFTFGRREDQLSDDFSVGVYGIGMKRAIFKIGEEIEIRSTYDDGSELEGFRVPINVPAWLAAGSIASDEIDPGDAGPGEAVSWDFDIEEAPTLTKAGVEIAITDLTAETSLRLGDETYARSLRSTLGRDYMIPLMRGLKISVNGVAVEGRKIEFRSSDDFAPMRNRYEDGSVSVEIVAGMISEPPDTSEPDENDRRKGSPFGWYVLCNGRVVLAADTTTLTGWGEELPMWHRQYAGFVGLALFASAHAVDLPMTTTKRSVDTSSAVYRRALTKMHEPSRAWIDYTNARKADLEAAKRRESQGSPQRLVDLEERPALQLPKVAGKSSREQIGNVNYAMPRRRLKALAEGLGDPKLSFRDIGIKSFDFAYEEFVGDES